MSNKKRIHPSELVGIAPDMTDGLPSDVWLQQQREAAPMMNLWQSNPAYREQVAAERADERRRVIEELAREAEEHVDALCDNYDELRAKELAAWLREHANCGRFATIGSGEAG